METKDNVKCDKCETETHKCMAIDNWAMKEDKHYCRKCQQEMKIGWYSEIKSKHRTPDDIIFCF
jgi:hypothetical protein